MKKFTIFLLVAISLISAIKVSAYTGSITYTASSAGTPPACKLVGGEAYLPTGQSRCRVGVTQTFDAPSAVLCWGSSAASADGSGSTYTFDAGYPVGTYSFGLYTPGWIGSGWNCSTGLLASKDVVIRPTIVAAAVATACGTGVARATGLVSTPTLTGNFNTTGACVKDSKATFAPYEIPTYEVLKSLYFTQSKATKVLSNSTNISPITSSDDGKIFNYTAADVNINGTYNYNGTAVIFINGNIDINKDIKGSPNIGLVIVVGGNVNIDKNVKQIDAVIISSGIIYTAGAGCSLRTNTVINSPLTVNGSLISLDEPIAFCRTLSTTDNSTKPAEIINSQPKYLVILRNLMSDTFQKWSEIQ